MARPRNNELFARVTHAAFRQFHERGYVKATYASIAKEAGCTTTIVQDYYGKKDRLARAFFDELIEVIRHESHMWAEEGNGPGVEVGSFAERFRDGCLYYAYLQGHCRQYLLETTQDVSISNAVLLDMARWAFTDSQRADVMDDPRSVERIISSLGGFHALLHHQLTHGEPFDVQRHFTDLALAWLDILGYTRDEILAIVRDGYLGAGEYQEICRRIARHYR